MDLCGALPALSDSERRNINHTASYYALCVYLRWALTASRGSTRALVTLQYLVKLFSAGATKEWFGLQIGMQMPLSAVCNSDWGSMLQFEL